MADGRCAANGAASGAATMHSQHTQVLQRLEIRDSGKAVLLMKMRQHRESWGKFPSFLTLSESVKHTSDLATLA